MAALVLMRMADEPPINGNDLARMRVLLAASSLRKAPIWTDAPQGPNARLTGRPGSYCKVTKREGAACRGFPVERRVRPRVAEAKGRWNADTWTDGRRPTDTIPRELLEQMPQQRGAIMGSGHAMTQSEGVMAARLAELSAEVRELRAMLAPPSAVILTGAEVAEHSSGCAMVA